MLEIGELRGGRSAAKFAETQGGLFSVQRQGKAPLLFSKQDQKPKFFGIESIHLRKRFHLKEAVQRVADRMQQIFDDMAERVQK
jgi:hypothetical protein